MEIFFFIQFFLPKHNGIYRSHLKDLVGPMYPGLYFSPPLTNVHDFICKLIAIIGSNCKIKPNRIKCRQTKARQYLLICEKINKIGWQTNELYHVLSSLRLNYSLVFPYTEFRDIYTYNLHLSRNRVHLVPTHKVSVCMLLQLPSAWIFL